MLPILELKNISICYHSSSGETLAVSDLSFSVNPGEFICIVGPSGCGKSSILSMLCGLISPSNGEVILRSDKSLGYMLQKDYLLEWRTIRSNCCLGLEIQNKLTPENLLRVEKMLEQYGLLEFQNHYPYQLSGGMRQRVALIRTLAIQPEILLLDEPFSALDYQTRLSVSDEISTIIRKENKTAILVTHDLSEAVATADRVIVLTKRPATLKAIHEIQLSIDNRSPLKTREAPEFKDYFNTIWKELDVHVC